MTAETAEKRLLFVPAILAYACDVERLAGAHELLDGPLDPALLAGNLRDLARVNRFLGGTRLSWRAVRAALERMPGRAGTVRLLDVGTGAADIPVALLDRARAAGYDLHVEAVDVRPEIVSAARDRVGGTANLAISSTSADRLDYPDDSFDVVHASLLLHHHDPPAAMRLLAELGRVAARRVVVNDLQRARRFHLAAWALTRVATGNRYTRHDAPLSVRRAYTADETSVLAAAAGLSEEARFRDRLGHRWALVLVPARRA